jgi:hypothetical protein
MTQAQALLEQMGCKGVTQRVNRDFFWIPHCATTAFMAAWVPPRSMGVVASRTRASGPLALGNSSRG